MLECVPETLLVACKEKRNKLSYIILHTTIQFNMIL